MDRNSSKTPEDGLAEVDISKETARTMFRRALYRFFVAWAVLSTILVTFIAHLGGAWGVTERELSLFWREPELIVKVTALATGVYVLVGVIAWRHILWTVYRKVKHAL